MKHVFSKRLRSFPNTVIANLCDDALLARLIAAHHRVALARARLPVRKDAHVVAIERMLQHLDADVFVDEGLSRKARVIVL